MDTLRISLLIVGLLLVMVIYVLSKSKQRSKKEQNPFGESWMKDDPLAKQQGEPSMPSIHIEGQTKEPTIPSFSATEPPQDLVEEFERLAVLLKESSTETTSVNPQVTESVEKSSELPEVVNPQITDAVTSVNSQVTHSVEQPDSQIADDEVVTTDAVGEPAEQAEAEAEQQTSTKTEVVVLHVMAGEGAHFIGKDLKQAILATGMIYGEMNIFHAYTGKAGKTAIFSLINSVEPGTFDLGAMDEMQTPGISLFMQLPLPVQPAEVFDTMYYTAKMVADKLGGVVMDKSRQPLTEESLQIQRQQLL